MSDSFLWELTSDGIRELNQSGTQLRHWIEEPNSSPDIGKCKNEPGEWTAGSGVDRGRGNVKVSSSEERHSVPWSGVPTPCGGSAIASQNLMCFDSSHLPWWCFTVCRKPRGLAALPIAWCRGVTTLPMIQLETSENPGSLIPRTVSVVWAPSLTTHKKNHKPSKGRIMLLSELQTVFINPLKNPQSLEVCISFSEAHTLPSSPLILCRRITETHHYTSVHISCSFPKGTWAIPNSVSSIYQALSNKDYGVWTPKIITENTFPRQEYIYLKKHYLLNLPCPLHSWWLP